MLQGACKGAKPNVVVPAQCDTDLPLAQDPRHLVRHTLVEVLLSASLALQVSMVGDTVT